MGQALRWRDICKLSLMKRSVTDFRRCLRLVWPLTSAVLLAASAVDAQESNAASREAAASPIAATPVDAVESLASIRATAQSYVRTLLPANVQEATIEVGSLDNRLHLAHCPQKELSASLPPGLLLQARSMVGVTCAGPVHWTVYVPVTVETRVKVLVLSHAVGRDARLTPADVTVESRRGAGPGTAYLTAPGELANKTLKRPLAAGTILAIDMFTPDLLVHRGQQVTLLSSGGALEVRASGRALADAGAGARIQVQNLSSLRVVEGVVESSDVVRIAR